MTYLAGGLIQATDYNGFVSTNAQNVNGTLTSYGQTTLSTVSAAATVTATQWATLNGSVASLAAHQGTTITSRTNPVAGNVISILSSLGTDITALNTNLYNAAASGTQFTGWTGTSSKDSATGSGAAAWTITFTHTVTFANTTAATNFFNAGGLVKVQFSKTSTGTVADPEWNDLANTLSGAIFLSSTAASKTISSVSYTGTTKIGGTGTPTTLATATGFAQLTSTPVTIYKQFADTAPYTGQYIQVNASVSGAVVTFVTTWVSPGGGTANITGGTTTTGISFGTAPATVVTYTPPSTANLTNTWGTPTVAATVS